MLAKHGIRPTPPGILASQCQRKSSPFSWALSPPVDTPPLLVLMAIQSACIPIPSEIIMPLAGYALAHTQAQLILLATVASHRLESRLHPRVLGRRPRRPSHGRALRAATCCSAAATSTSSTASSIASAPLPCSSAACSPSSAPSSPFPPASPRWTCGSSTSTPSSAPGPGATRSPTSACASEPLGTPTPRFKQIFDRFHLGVEAVLAALIVLFVWTHWKNRIRTEPA